MNKNKISVLGGGSWGTVLAYLASLNGNEVTLWMRDEEVAKEIGADWLIYQDLDDLINSAKEGNPMIKNFEMSIFDGKYPTSISSDYLEDLESSRKDDQKVAREKSN